MKSGTATLQHAITDDLTQDWKSLLSLANTAALFIFSGDENQGRKWNRIYFYFKLTLLHKGKTGFDWERHCRKPSFPRKVISSLHESQWRALILWETSAAPQHQALRYLSGTAASLHCAQQTRHLRVEETTEAAKNFQKILS